MRTVSSTTVENDGKVYFNGEMFGRIAFNKAQLWTAYVIGNSNTFSCEYGNHESAIKYLRRLYELGM